MTTFNGYTNYETWNFSMHYSDYLQETIQDYQDQTNERLEYGQIHDMVNGEMDYIIEEMEITDGFINDMIGMAFQRIDIHQIVTNIHDELEFEEIE